MFHKCSSGRWADTAAAVLAKQSMVVVSIAHCCRNGHRFDLGYQRQFQCYMNHKGVGFQKM